jgi:hypothetical protein
VAVRNWPLDSWINRPIGCAALAADGHLPKKSCHSAGRYHRGMKVDFDEVCWQAWPGAEEGRALIIGAASPEKN